MESRNDRTTGTYISENRMQASVARCLRTPPYTARCKGLDFGLVTAYAATATGARLSLAIVLCSPVTVADSRDKANPFRRSSILFRPHVPPTRVFGGAAGYRPRVRSAYYERVYVHSPACTGHHEYRQAAPSSQPQPWWDSGETFRSRQARSGQAWMTRSGRFRTCPG